VTLTAFDEKVQTMRRIVDAADGRDLTASQARDFESASKQALAEAIDHDALPKLTASLKSVHDLPALVDAFEGWSESNNHGRVSAGRATKAESPSGPLYGTSGAAYGTKAVDWGRDFIQERSRSAKALLEAGSTAVATPIFAQPIADPRQARFVYELLPSSEAEGGLFGYLKQTVRTNNAAEVATGTLKPTSIYTLQRVNDTTKVFAHLSQPIDKFLVEDAPNLTQFLNAEMRNGLQKALDAHVITDITAAATTGTAGTFDLAGIRSAITELQEIDLEPTAIVMTPGDWEVIEDEATTTFASNDNAPAATDAMRRRLYDVPVVVTNSATAGQALVGDFAGSARLFTTGSAQITVHDSQPRDVSGTLYADYALNQLVFRAELRAEVAPWRGSGFILVEAAS
jgi:HK97 family phage major capsid protein